MAGSPVINGACRETLMVLPWAEDIDPVVVDVVEGRRSHSARVSGPLAAGISAESPLRMTVAQHRR